MATYFFSSFTQAQAQAFNASTDSIFFNTAETGRDFRVSINPVLGVYSVTTTTGRSFDFGPGVLGANFTLADGSTVQIGTGQADSLTGTPGNDGLFGGDGNDFLSGGNGDDVLNGGAGADTLDGGNGANLFIFDVGQSLVATPDLINWTSSNTLEFTGMSGQAGRYEEATQATLADATAFANGEIASGRADYVAVAVGVDVLVFADDRNNDGVADDMVRIGNASLGQISAANIKGAVDAAPVTPPPPTGGADTLPEPTLPGVPASVGVAATVITVAGGFADGVDLSQVNAFDVTAETSTEIDISATATFAGQTYHPVTMLLRGTGFVYDSAGDPVSGVVTDFSETVTVPVGNALQSVSVTISQAHFSLLQLITLADSADPNALTNGLYGGNDVGSGGALNDVLRGFDGNDTLSGQQGSDTIFGGNGNDVIYGRSATGAGVADPADQNYLRGEAGDDYVIGGGGFDDINGNQGNDTLSGGAGDDWVVGGKDNDLQFGDAGNDIVWGNLGNDTLVGGDGNDQVRGGQGDDVIFGGAGEDYLSGDRGNDTIVGGAGADIFHSFSGAGVDRVLDFHLGEGDRVMLDPGTTFTVSQSGQDTVIDMGNGDLMILVGVQASSLPAGTIFLG